MLFKCVNNLLTDNGTFVFVTSYPCFDTLTEKYKTAHSYYGEALKDSLQYSVIIIVV